MQHMQFYNEGKYIKFVWREFLKGGALTVKLSTVFDIIWYEIRKTSKANWYAFSNDKDNTRV